MPTPVLILGSGVVGLTSAIRLLEAGHPVTIVHDRPLSEGPSIVAPALFTPYQGPPHDTLVRWIEESLRSLRAIERSAGSSVHPSGGHSAGIHTAPVRWYKFSKDSPADGPWEHLLNERPIPVPPNVPVAAILETDRPHIDTTRYLPWLHARATSLGARFVMERVTAFDQLFDRGARVIINCAGLGSRELARDPRVRPVRGIIARLPNHLRLTRGVHDDSPGGLVTYVFVYPTHLAIGSTFQLDDWNAAITANEFEPIFDRARRLLGYDGIANANDLSPRDATFHIALRPARVRDGAGENFTFEDIRLELERTSRGPIIHNYGHGRMGISLSWGTARDALELVRSLQ
ncbi:MAG: FAD-dependent oxidoreductase [Phycisphaerales bacterium]